MEVAVMPENTVEQKLEDTTAELLVSYIELFKKAKELKQYVEAQRQYKLCQNRATENLRRRLSAELFDLEYCYVEMQMDQKKLDKAKKIARNMWTQAAEKEVKEGESSKKSLRLYIRILLQSKDFDGVEVILRPIYHKKIKDDWALEAGDMLCEALADQHEYVEAENLQAQIFRRRHERNGPALEGTVQSRIWRVKDLESQEYVCNCRVAKDKKTKMVNQWKEIHEHRVMEALADVWRGKEAVGNEDMLNAGHRLGGMYIYQNNALHVEAVLRHVWTSRKELLGKDHTNTTRSGLRYGIYLAVQNQSSRVSKGTHPGCTWTFKPKNAEASKVFHEIWDNHWVKHKGHDADVIRIAIEMVDVDWTVGKHSFIETHKTLHWLLQRGPNEVEGETKKNLKKALTWSEKQQSPKKNVMLLLTYRAHKKLRKEIYQQESCHYPSVPFAQSEDKMPTL